MKVVFLWHMHQPYYKDPLQNEYLLPWVYLHGIKDYYDMGVIIDEVPEARAVFNFVPSLLEQLEDYVSGKAVDRFLILGKKAPAEMSKEEKLFVIENFFDANRQRLIEPYHRYFELFYKARAIEKNEQELLKEFRDQDILDLQVCFFLAWTGEAARRNFPELQKLVDKGRCFTEKDKEILFSTHIKILSSIIPLYKKLHEQGKIELSVTPYFHPILPLLCDIQSARHAMPGVPLPEMMFHHPEDARNQIVAAITKFREVFGFDPTGMWPSEGSVSDDAISIIADYGFKWIATDEDVLIKTLNSNQGFNREQIYHPYRYQKDGKAINIFFRDHKLSDLIGFTYSQWDESSAIKDLVGKLHSIAASGSDNGVVSIIMDGENAWEYYRDNAYNFLKGLYFQLSSESGLELSTFKDSAEPNLYLEGIYPGSWINADYRIWVGHPEKNRGWDLLAKAREDALNSNSVVASLLNGDNTFDFNKVEDYTASGICRALFAAEGSDWFWWYGDDHFSPQSDTFDLLFRQHLMNVYRLLGQEIPTELYEPIKKKRVAGAVKEPSGFIYPQITGTINNYFEWLDAGLYDLSKQGSAMHSAENLLRSFFYGFDKENLFFRIDGSKPLSSQLHEGDNLTLYILSENEFKVVMSYDQTSTYLLRKQENGIWQNLDTLCNYKIKKICEVQVPLYPFKLQAESSIFAYITFTRRNEELGRWPVDAPMKLVYAGEEVEMDSWLI
ncbi:MAG: glycoside hydrolase family 57 protein [Desulfuromonadales bacterium]|nr:glycoside hydrolase family 57 protein [Desulfuromonadales bacterium]